MTTTRREDLSTSPTFPWWAALRLGERHRLVGREFATWTSGLDDAARERARRRLDRWRSTLGQDPDLWLQWIDQRFGDLRPRGGQQERFQDEALEDEVLRVVATPKHAPDLDAPEWTEVFQRLYMEPSEESPLQAQGLLAAAQPLLADALRRLDQAFGELAASMEDDEVARRVSWGGLRQGLMQQLSQRLRRRLLPTLVTELRIAGLEERLEGDTPEARFESFVQELRDGRRCVQLLAHYPTLLRQLWSQTERWLDGAKQVLRRLLDDHAQLMDFLGHGAGPAVRLQGSGGDPHRGGRQVLFVHLEDGSKVVYKPRPLALEQGFQGLLDWLSPQVPWPLRSIRFLDRGDYGWMEWLEASPCATTSEVEAFYGRQGILLALLHLLGATDLHHENLLAAGPHPLILDLETLCHPPLASPNDEDPSALGPFEDTVLRVGLLPQRLPPTGAGDGGLDATGLGAELGQATPGESWQLEGEGGDGLRLVAAEGRLRETPGRPRLGEQWVDPVAYGDRVADGFLAARQALQAHREELLTADGPLAFLRGAVSRVVARPTRIYGRLLQESFHPQLLPDAVLRERHFDRLWQQVPARPWLLPLLPSEADDLWDGDIPYFHARVDSRHLWDARGEDLGELVAESGLEGVQRRLRRLDEGETQRQLTLVRQSFSLRAAEQGKRPRPRSGSLQQSDAAATSEDFLEGAFGAADWLSRRAFVDSRGARWWAPRRLTSQHPGVSRWMLDEAGPNLYDGVAGIALFLAQLARVGGRPEDRQLAEAATLGLTRQLEMDTKSLASMGLSTVGAPGGWAGVIYALTRLASLLDQPHLHGVAEQCVLRLTDALPEDDRFDVLDGAAGALLVLCRDPFRSTEAARAAARRAGDHLLQGAQPQSVGWGWPPPDGAGGPLAGLSHGASGIAWGLTELASSLATASESGNGRPYAEAALEALRYESTLESKASSNWRDLRKKPEGEPDDGLYAWCHGAPGVVMARLGLLDALDELPLDEVSPNGPARRDDLQDNLRRELQVAVDGTWRHGFGLTHSLCHGDLGNLDALLLAASRGVLPQGVEDAEVLWRRGAQILRDVQERGGLFGSPGGTEPPGMWLGMAGIGYQLLRLAAPRQVPSVLALSHRGDAEPASSGARPWWPQPLHSKGVTTHHPTKEKP